VANGDSSIWTIGTVYGDMQDISQWQLATLKSGQSVQCMETPSASGQVVPVAAELIGIMPCMKLHRTCQSGKWQLW